MQKKILIITYYWPPAGGSGVQRWLKFSKYLREFGWEPIIYTPQNPEISIVDNSLIHNLPSNIKVIKRRVFEPYKFFRLLTGEKGNMGVGFTSADGGNKGVLGRFSLWLRANYFIPDARMFWIKPSVRFLCQYLKENPVDVVISTGPPHSMHLIALGLKQKLGIKWVADFRDPWTNIDYISELPLTRRSLAEHQRLERKVVSNCDAVVVVSSQMKAEFESIRPNGIHLVTNGFDGEDFPTLSKELDPEFTLTHVGSIPQSRNCQLLWHAIKLKVDSDPDFAGKLKIQLVGSVDRSVSVSIDQYGLSHFCKFTGYLSHNQSVELMQRSQVLLLLVNNSPNAKGILTGKVFEYLAAGRPILAIGPLEGDVDKLLRETKAGVIANFFSIEDIGLKLDEMWNCYRRGFPEYSNVNPEAYSRKNLTKQLANILDSLV